MGCTWLSRYLFSQTEHFEIGGREPELVVGSSSRIDADTRRIAANFIVLRLDSYGTACPCLANECEHLFDGPPARRSSFLDPKPDLIPMNESNGISRRDAH